MTEAVQSADHETDKGNEQDNGTGQIEESTFGIFYVTELDRLEAEARELVDEYWDTYWEIRKTRPKTEWGNLGVWIQRRETGLSIEWYKVRFRQGEKKPMMIHIPRCKTHDYQPGAFRRAKAKEWEMETALALEKRFGNIRRQVKMLSQMRRYYNEFTKAYLEGKSTPGECLDNPAKCG